MTDSPENISHAKTILRNIDFFYTKDSIVFYFCKILSYSAIKTCSSLLLFSMVPFPEGSRAFILKNKTTEKTFLKECMRILKYFN